MSDKKKPIVSGSGSLALPGGGPGSVIDRMAQEVSKASENRSLTKNYYIESGITNSAILMT